MANKKKSASKPASKSTYQGAVSKKNAVKSSTKATDAKTKKPVVPSLTDTSGVDGYFRPEIQGSRWSFGSELFTGNFTLMIGINLLMLLFIAPILYFLFVRFSNILSAAASAPFTSNMGVGYLPFSTMLGYEESIILTSNVKFFMLLPLMGIWLSIGLSGGFYLMRNLSWGENVSVFKDFFKGVKKNFFPILIATSLYTVVLSVSAVAISYLDYHVVVNQKEWYHVLFKVILYIILCFSTLYYLTSLPMIVTYNGTFFQMLKNCFVVAATLLPLNAFFAALGLLPFLLLFFGQSTLSLALILILFLGGSFFLVVWTVYNGWIYEKFINGRVAEEYTPTQEEVKKHEDRTSGQNTARANEGYLEVGAKKTSRLSGVAPVTDYDVKVHDIGGVFTRADLEKLRQSKEDVKSSAKQKTEKAVSSPSTETIVDLTVGGEEGGETNE